LPHSVTTHDDERSIGHCHHHVGGGGSDGAHLDDGLVQADESLARCSSWIDLTGDDSYELPVRTEVELFPSSVGTRSSDRYNSGGLLSFPWP
jgi:hypothetical protein